MHQPHSINHFPQGAVRVCFIQLTGNSDEDILPSTTSQTCQPRVLSSSHLAPTVALWGIHNLLQKRNRGTGRGKDAYSRSFSQVVLKLGCKPSLSRDHTISCPPHWHPVSHWWVFLHLLCVTDPSEYVLRITDALEDGWAHRVLADALGFVDTSLSIYLKILWWKLYFDHCLGSSSEMQKYFLNV